MLDSWLEHFVASPKRWLIRQSTSPPLNMCPHNTISLIWYVPYTEKFWWGKNWRIWRIVSYSPKFPIHKYTEHVFGIYALTVAYSPIFPHQWLLPGWFTKIFPHPIFPVYGSMTVCGSCDCSHDALPYIGG